MTPGMTPAATHADGPRRASFAIGLVVATGSLLALVGRAFDIPRLTDWSGTGLSQLPNNAIGLFCCGLGLVGLARGFKAVAFVLGLASAAIGGAVLYQHATGVDLGIDTLVLHRDWGQAATVTPGRTAPEPEDGAG